MHTTRQNIEHHINSSLSYYSTSELFFNFPLSGDREHLEIIPCLSLPLDYNRPNIHWLALPSIWSRILASQLHCLDCCAVTVHLPMKYYNCNCSHRHTQHPKCQFFQRVWHAVYYCYNYHLNWIVVVMMATVTLKFHY